MLIVLAEGAGSDGKSMILRHDEWPLKRIKSYPAKILTFHQGIKTWLQKPMLMMAGADNIQALQNEMLDSILSIVRKEKNILLYDSDVYTETDILKAIRAPDFSAIGVSGLGKVGAGSILPLAFGHVQADKGNFIALITSLFDRSAGTPQPIVTEANETATEVSIKERRTNAREDARLDDFQQYQIETAEMFWDMSAEFVPEREFQTDPTNQDSWVSISDEDAESSFSFEIDVSSQASGLALERKQWMDLLNLLGGMVDVSSKAGWQIPNLPKIFEQLAIRGYEIPNPEELWPAVKSPGAAMPSPLPAGGNGSGSSPGPILPQQFNAPAPKETNMAGTAGRL